MTKFLIVNADDFGFTQGVNRGIIEAHLNGIVTSTSLMVDAPWAAEATTLARQLPLLGIGLHFVSDAEAEHKAFWDTNEVQRALDRQYQLFVDMIGKEPTHIDSHHHFHMKEKNLDRFFRDWAMKHRLPIRGMGGIHFQGGFFGWRFDKEWRAHPSPENISFENLTRIFETLPEGYTEIACHPGYATPDLDLYAEEREIELKTLLDPRLPKVLRNYGIKLINYIQWPGSHEVCPE